jgi:hypothetical protein|uniref:Uncharacterized protein n=1 Tax=viral metagenome TaxID=1070528 RepID=A0A6C0CXD8_9ZZZZ
MEQEIHFTNKEFDFSKLSLSQPIAVQGGAYFTKLKFNSDPFYIQTPKCLTKQGINETSKKAYMDLMFTSDDDEVIEWFETLESTLVNLIFQKKHLWFQDDIEFGDIENFFNPITRAYKGGKFHLIRTSITKNKTNNQYTCGVYDENENVLPITDIKESNIIIPILEVIGIKFSARNFQLELVGKQIMVLNNKPIFNSCLIKRNNNMSKSVNNNNLEEESSHLEEENSHLEENSSHLESTTKIETESNENKESIHESSSNIIDELLEDNEIEEEIKADNKKEIALEDLELKEEINEVDLEESNDLEDVSEKINTTNTETIKLKNPNEVYMEIYKIAKQKAKQHKKAAISAYLEAKKIKNTYLLEDLENSEDSSDEEENDSDTEQIKNQINEIIEELN